MGQRHTAGRSLLQADMFAEGVSLLQRATGRSPLHGGVAVSAARNAHDRAPGVSPQRLQQHQQHSAMRPALMCPDSSRAANELRTILRHHTTAAANPPYAASPPSRPAAPVPFHCRQPHTQTHTHASPIPAQSSGYARASTRVCSSPPPMCSGVPECSPSMLGHAMSRMSIGSFSGRDAPYASTCHGQSDSPATAYIAGVLSPPSCSYYGFSDSPIDRSTDRGRYTPYQQA